MVRKLFATSNDFTLTVLRVVLGVVMFAHGSQKVLGWFGGHGLKATFGAMTTIMHIPAPFAALAIAAEFLGGLGLIFGFLGRIAAFGIAVEMAVAAIMVHAGNGFFMNWLGNQKGEGFEYHLLAIAIGTAVMVRGSGAFSVDRLIAGTESEPANLRTRAAA
jgi:putative oxidoreductase